LIDLVVDGIIMLKLHVEEMGYNEMDRIHVVQDRGQWWAVVPW
jgi:hypothetical protein